MYAVGSVVNTFGIKVGEPLLALLWLLQARPSQCSTRSCSPQLHARVPDMHMAIRLPASFCCLSATCIRGENLVLPCTDMSGKACFLLDIAAICNGTSSVYGSNCCMHANPAMQRCDTSVCVGQGVQEHTFFFKSIANANALRQRVCECFERAALPQTSQEVCHQCGHSPMLQC